MVDLISELEAIKLLGRDFVEIYHDKMAIHKDNLEEKRVRGEYVPSDWGWHNGEDYVSLPFLHMSKVRKESEAFDELRKNPLVIVHPGYIMHSEYYDYTVFNKKKYGDYEEDYLVPLRERILVSAEDNRPIFVYMPQNRRESTLNFMKRHELAAENMFLVPTMPAIPDINEYILGVDNNGFNIFLKGLGVDTIEVCGEVNGHCYDDVIKVLSNDFKIKEGPRFPSKVKLDPIKR